MAHRNCTSTCSSFQRKFITMRRRIESITWCHMLKSPRRTWWLAARRWRRLNTSLSTILFEMLKKTDNIPPWFSPTEPKPVDQNQRAKVYWDELVYAKNTEVRVNTIDVRKINKEDKKVTLLEMSSPWMENREAKDSKMTMRYAPLGCHPVACVGCELKMQKCRSGGDNIILDVLRGASMNTAKSIKTLIRERPGRKT